MIQKAHQISLEAGSKMARAMKDVIFAAAGLTPFAVESAKDLINYMVRRGQMSSEEANRIIADIEDAAVKRGVVPQPAEKEAAKATPAAKKEAAAPAAKAPAEKPEAAAPAAKKAAAPAKKAAKKS